MLLSWLLASVCFSAAYSASDGNKMFVKCGSTEGDFKIELRPDWAPKGVERFVALVEDGFFDGSAVFRSIENFVAQFGIATDPDLTEKWRDAGEIRDDKRKPEMKGGPPRTFPRGGVSFAG
jgi:cyclophilin family peptidyl-prolyl cis-trans isomerase